MKYTKTKRMFLLFLLIVISIQLIQFLSNTTQYIKEVDQYILLVFVSVFVFLFLWARMAFDNYKGKKYLIRCIRINLIVSSFLIVGCFCFVITNIVYISFILIFIGMFLPSLSYYLDIINLSDDEIYKKRDENYKIVV
jgi:hypothetical protein